MFEHRFLPMKNDDSFRTPPPLKDNHRVCDHNAMLAFPQEQISHYTTAYDTISPYQSHHTLSLQPYLLSWYQRLTLPHLIRVNTTTI